MISYWANKMKNCFPRLHWLIILGYEGVNCSVPNFALDSVIIKNIKKKKHTHKLESVTTEINSEVVAYYFSRITLFSSTITDWKICEMNKLYDCVFFPPWFFTLPFRKIQVFKIYVLVSIFEARLRYFHNNFYKTINQQYTITWSLN